MKHPPQSVAEAAVHVENFITALVNAYKLQTTALSQKIGIATFYQVVSFVCDNTWRHPTTRQFFSSCIEILGQVFIQDTQQECKQMLSAISVTFCPTTSPPTLRPGSWSTCMRRWCSPCTGTVETSSSCCSPRLCRAAHQS